MVNNDRNKSIDAMKGLLILLVVIGHVLLGSLDDNPLRYLIYSFHMQAFFFISGFLFNVEKIKYYSFTNLCSKYWKRMLKMWLIAWLVYTIYAIRDDFSIISILRQIYNPYYHLWFIPALFLTIVISHFVLRNVKSMAVSLCILLTLGIFTYNLSRSEFKLSSFISLNTSLFFFLGLILRRIPPINIKPVGGDTCIRNDCVF